MSVKLHCADQIAPTSRFPGLRETSSQSPTPKPETPTRKGPKPVLCGASRPHFPYGRPPPPHVTENPPGRPRLRTRRGDLQPLLPPVSHHALIPSLRSAPPVRHATAPGLPATPTPLHLWSAPPVAVRTTPSPRPHRASSPPGRADLQPLPPPDPHRVSHHALLSQTPALPRHAFTATAPRVVPSRGTLPRPVRAGPHPALGLPIAPAWRSFPLHRPSGPRVVLATPTPLEPASTCRPGLLAHAGRSLSGRASGPGRRGSRPGAGTPTWGAAWRVDARLAVQGAWRAVQDAWRAVRGAWRG